MKNIRCVAVSNVTTPVDLISVFAMRRLGSFAKLVDKTCYTDPIPIPTGRRYTHGLACVTVAALRRRHRRARLQLYRAALCGRPDTGAATMLRAVLCDPWLRQQIRSFQY